MMAAKARLLENTLERAVTSDEETQENTSLKGQFETFKQILIHDLTPKGFADIYAQTLAYGMFAARLHDPSLENFSRQEAAELIPKTNPFLRKLFQYVAGYDIDPRIKTTVDNLAEVFRATDVNALLQNLGNTLQANDPVIHFYETFLAAYDPALRKSRGVWYTPHPVVSFIVRAVDDILKTYFNLTEGIANTSKVKIKVPVQGSNKTAELEVHKVQFLDPATGTGTFIDEVVKHIYKTQFQYMQGAWSSYVEEHLIPRLNGFELLMASYTMAHLKLDMLLAETGYKPTKEQRFNIYLTNSLEEHHPDTGTLFANWLSSEANQANHIKRDTPVMVVMGNPPYSVSSSNKNAWIENLVADYKKDLNERNIQPLSDDYIKFIRFGQHFIEKNGEGILAYISNNSFIDGLIHRQMRKNLIETFDKIYILDLHGNAKKKETAPDGGKDENVFDIMQGVSINIFVKSGRIKNNKQAQVYHFDVFGKRQDKYDFLDNHSLGDIKWNELQPDKPSYFLVSKDFEGKGEYEKGFKIDEIFKIISSGIKTHDDGNLISFSKFNQNNELYYYRPFDIRNIDYDLNKVVRHRFSVLKNMLYDNIALLIPKQAITALFGYFVSKGLTDINYTGVAGQFGAGLVIPLYLYSESNKQKTLGITTERTHNLNQEIVKQLADKLSLTFVPEKEPEGKVCYINNAEVRPDFRSIFAPIDILDYIYAVLHSPTYREKYKEFLKIDFPRVPYPKDAETFWQLVELGGEIRQIHLLESQKVNQFITSYPNDGNNTVTRKMTNASPGWESTNEEKTIGRVWINDQQYFDGVPLIAWEFYIGGYQPAQKWLKDRNGRTLNFEDILHYQKIIVALTETHRLMQEVDKIGVE